MIWENLSILVFFLWEVSQLIFLWLFRVSLGPFGDQFYMIWDLFVLGSLSVFFCDCLGSAWGHYGINLTWFGAICFEKCLIFCFWIVGGGLRQVWDHFELILHNLGVFVWAVSQVFFVNCWGSVRGHSGIIFRWYGIFGFCFSCEKCLMFFSCDLSGSVWGNYGTMFTWFGIILGFGFWEVSPVFFCKMIESVWGHSGIIFRWFWDHFENCFEKFLKSFVKFAGLHKVILSKTRLAGFQKVILGKIRFCWNWNLAFCVKWIKEGYNNKTDPRFWWHGGGAQKMQFQQ